MQSACACAVHASGPAPSPTLLQYGVARCLIWDAPCRRLRGDLPTEAVAEWLARGGEVDARSTRGGEMTMLMAAAVGGVTGTVELLLARRATIDLTDEHGATALMSAPTHLTLPAPPLPPTTKPPPPPFHAAATPRPPTTTATATSAIITTAAAAAAHRYAAQEGRTDVALALLRAGASPTAEDADGATPTQVAEEWQRVGILRAMSLGPDAAVLLDDRRETLSSMTSSPPVPLQPVIEGA